MRFVVLLIVLAGSPALADEARGLTPRERVLLQPLFRESLDYDAVRVIHGRFIPFQPATRYMSPEGNIYAPGALYREDFADPAVSADLRAIFVHEMLHVWQHQSGMNLLAAGVGEYLKLGGAYERAYAYVLAAERDLLDYGLEQQASIVQDFFLLATGRAAHRAVGGGDVTLFRAVLGRFLGDPRYARAQTPGAVARRHTELAKASPPPPPPAKTAPSPLCAWRFAPH
jgi:hypothetical protein